MYFGESKRLLLICLRAYVSYYAHSTTTHTLASGTMRQRDRRHAIGAMTSVAIATTVLAAVCLLAHDARSDPAISPSGAEEDQFISKHESDEFQTVLICLIYY